MSDRLQTYENDAVVVTFDPKVCTHSGNCVRGLAAVFDVKKKPWVNVDAASADAVVLQVGKCPSGALQARRK
jgi:uncharacterized Fe-S cluster protein YjdI